MASANRIVDDMARVMSGAAGVAQGALKEAETRMKSWTRKFVQDEGFVKRDEFEAVAEMAKKARAENVKLQKEIDEIKAQLAGTSESKPAKTKATKTATKDKK